MMLDDETLRRVVGSQGPAQPAPDLVARIMDNIPSAPATESIIDQWIRIAWPVALVSGVAAAVLGLAVLGKNRTEPLDPVSALTQELDTDLGQVLAIER